MNPVTWGVVAIADANATTAITCKTYDDDDDDDDDDSTDFILDLFFFRFSFLLIDMQDNLIYIYKYYYRTEYFSNLKVVQLRQNCMNDGTVQYIWILVTQKK